MYVTSILRGISFTLTAAIADDMPRRWVWFDDRLVCVI